jgi:putative transposase
MARIVIPGLAHHITQRGNNRQDVFFTDDDRRAYLGILRKQSERFGLVVLGYCLMTNHVHLIAIPADEESLARGIGRTHWLYSLYINRLHHRSGHLWQNRFFSCALDHGHVLGAMAYLELNPVRAKTARYAHKYPWSSAAAHIQAQTADPHQLLDLPAWRKMTPEVDWGEYLGRFDDKASVAALRYATHRGRPLGSESFLSRLEVKLGRRLRPLPVGRPKEKEQEGKRKGKNR